MRDPVAKHHPSPVAGHCRGRRAGRRPAADGAAHDAREMWPAGQSGLGRWASDAVCALTAPHCSAHTAAASLSPPARSPHQTNPDAMSRAPCHALPATPCLPRPACLCRRDSRSMACSCLNACAGRRDRRSATEPRPLRADPTGRGSARVLWAVSGRWCWAQVDRRHLRAAAGAGAEAGPGPGHGPSGQSAARAAVSRRAPCSATTLVESAGP